MKDRRNLHVILWPQFQIFYMKVGRHSLKGSGKLTVSKKFQPHTSHLSRIIIVSACLCETWLHHHVLFNSHADKKTQVSQNGIMAVGENMSLLLLLAQYVMIFVAMLSPSDSLFHVCLKKSPSTSLHDTSRLILENRAASRKHRCGAAAWLNYTRNDGVWVEETFFVQQLTFKS